MKTPAKMTLGAAAAYATVFRLGATWELQHLAVGDRILDGPPDQDCWFNVEQVEPERHLVLRSRTHIPVAWRERFGWEMDWGVELAPGGPGAGSQPVSSWPAVT